VSVVAATERAPGQRWVRFAIAGCWVGVFVEAVLLWGLPLDRLQVMAWIVATLALVAGLTGGVARRLLVDWLPLAGLLLAYDLTRGAVDTLGMPVQVESVASVESAIFGGEVPTIWLQQRLYQHYPWSTRWWEAVVALIYVSHFVVPYVVGGWHWSRGRERWLYWRRRFVGVTVVGLVIFTLLPAAPPWFASDRGVIEKVHRTSVRGWSVLGLDTAGWVLDMGQASVNLVAAVPSLHAGYAALVVALFWEGRRLSVRLALLAYPAAMGFVLVLTGEHYVVDVLAGFAVVAVVCWAARQWERRRLPDRAAGGSPDAVPAVPETASLASHSAS
jgi:hypothetical protein